MFLVFDGLTKSLARNIGTAEDLKPRSDPGIRAAGQHRDIAPSHSHQRGGGLVRQAFIGVDQHNAGVAARHEAINQQLEPPQRGGRGEKYVAMGKYAALAHIQHGDFLAIAEGRLERLRCQQRMANQNRRREGSVAAAISAFEHHTPVQPINGQTVEMQVQSRLIADQFNRVHVVGRERHRDAGHHVHGANGHQLVAVRIAGLVPCIDDVALAASNAGNDGPGGVVVRRLELARQTGRNVKRQTSFHVFCQPIDLRRICSGHRKVRRWKNILAQAQLRECLGHGAQCIGTGVLVIGQQTRHDLEEGVNGVAAAARDVAAVEVQADWVLSHEI